MEAATSALAAFLMAGSPIHNETMAVVLTADRQYTYVAARDCLLGQGWMMKAAPGDKHAKKYTYWFIGQNSYAATLATIMCYPYTHPRRRLTE